MGGRQRRSMRQDRAGGGAYMAIAYLQVALQDPVVRAHLFPPPPPPRRFRSPGAVQRQPTAAVSPHADAAAAVCPRRAAPLLRRVTWLHC
eukprot:SAG31_NODE_1830_length_7152_cov_2.148306_4_plen_90_part_00